VCSGARPTVQPLVPGGLRWVARLLAPPKVTLVDDVLVPVAM